MKKTTRAFILCGAALAIAAAVRFLPVPDSGTIPAAATFKLSNRQLAELSSLALAGDCKAAEKIGRHYLFFSLQYDSAVEWYRLAAKCPNANAKSQLVALLKDYPKDSDEVDKLLREISALDSTIAEDAREAVNLSRHEAARRKNER